MSIIFVNFIIISNILLCLLYIFTSNLFVLTLDKLFLHLQMLSYHLYHSIFCILSINSELNFNFTIHFIYFIFLHLIFNVLILWKMICFYTEIAKILTRFSTIFSLFVLTFVNSLLVIYQFLCYTKYNYNKIGGIIIGKTTMKDIADALNISRVTVSKAFNNQVGVSDSLRELIFEKARELGYTKLPYQVAEPPERGEHTISLVVSRPDSALFWTNIIHRMAQELSKYSINLLYTYVPSSRTKEFSLPSVLTNGNVDGIIVVNVYDADILDMVNRLSLPKVFLDSNPSIHNRDLTGDLILIEGFCTEQEITQLLISDGHTKIGFLGDIGYARTNLERYKGFCSCMEKYHIPIQSKYCLTRNIDIYSYDRELSAFLNSLTDWPTAFVCVSDYVAHFVQSYIDDNSQRLPHPVVLTGFDNSGEYTNVSGHIITANVPTSLLGKRLAMQLLFRTEHPDAPYELTFLSPSIIIPNNRINKRN